MPTAESFELMKAYTSMQVANLHLHSIIHSPTVHGTAKQRFRMAQRRIQANINDLRFCVPDASRHILDEQMLNDEIAMQLDNIYSLLCMLPKGIRDQVEATVEAHANTLILNNQ